MNHNFSRSEQLKQTVEKAIEELRTAEDNCSRFAASFPHDITHGLISFRTATEEDISAHLIFGASLSDCTTKTGATLSELTQLMMIADAENCNDIIILCDGILTAYKNYLNDINHYLNQTNRAIQKNKTNTRLGELYSYLSDHLRKIKIFSSYLMSLDI